MTGIAEGLNFRYVGVCVISVGSALRAALMAACTSRTAPSMSRSRSNCSTICDEPCELCEVTCSSPAIEPNARSSGAVTVFATVSASAPASWALTMMTGKSTDGRAATGSSR